MATKQNKSSTPTNFDVWKEQLAPEHIAGGGFITFSCTGCPAYGESCSRYDAKCRANFLKWAHAKAELSPEPPEEAAEGGGT
jgi:hypothetical protein